MKKYGFLRNYKSLLIASVTTVNLHNIIYVYNDKNGSFRLINFLHNYNDIG